MTFLKPLNYSQWAIRGLSANVILKEKRLIKKRQIELKNIKENKTDYSGYNSPKVIAPKRKIIKEKPKNKPLKKKEFIHHLDDMDRIKNRINLRRVKL